MKRKLFGHLDKNIFKLIKESNKEEKNFVRAGSDLDLGMISGKTNFPYGDGYPNYKPKYNDNEDFKEIAKLDYIVDVSDEHIEADDKKRKDVIYNYIKTKLPDFYNKFKVYIDEMFDTYINFHDIYFWMNSLFYHRPNEFKNLNITDDDINSLKKISDTHHKLYKLIHHRNDPHNELNYPLYVSLYDLTRAFGGYEEGGWWYDKCKLINSIDIKNPTQLLPAAENLYTQISNFDGKPKIYVEKIKGSQEENESPKYS